MSSLSMRLCQTENLIPVLNPFDGKEISQVKQTSALDVEDVLVKAHVGAQAAKALPRHQRASILDKAAYLIEQRNEQFARQITAEAGKTIRQATKEVARCVNTLKLSAELARSNEGEMIPFDAFPGGEKRKGWFSREPLGIILAITPFNDPLNLVAHKLGPAIAGGNAVLLKPSEMAPLSAMALVDILQEAGMPPDVVTLAIGGADLGAALVEARDVRMISFTGGFKTGEAISRTAGLKRLCMDLGGNAPVIVMKDCDFEKAIEACVSGAFWAAGQNCIGTQRIFIQRPLYNQFRGAFMKATAKLVVGDPQRMQTDVGPMINELAAKSIEARVNQALDQGAKCLHGNKREGALYHPTVLETVPHDCAIWCDEVFAPVVILEPFDDLEDALTLSNEVDFSLHAGIFTSDIDTAMTAIDRIQAGGIMINDSSDYRFDAMPFGGFKYGSMGREGVRFAYEDMTQPKVICFNNG